MDLQSTIRLNNGVEIPQQALGVFKVENDRCAECVRWALEAGYRHIDTAAVYGNERGVGQGIRDSGVNRQDIFLTTKLWNDDMRKGRVREAFEESLEKLGTSYVDLYLIHWPVPGVFEKCWAEMETLYRQGRVRAIGVSNFHQYHMEALLKSARIIPAVNQIELHPLLTQKPLSAYCRALGIEIEAYRPLGGTGKYNLVNNPDIAAVGAHYRKIWRTGIAALEPAARQHRAGEIHASGSHRSERRYLRFRDLSSGYGAAGQPESGFPYR